MRPFIFGGEKPRLSDDQNFIETPGVSGPRPEVLHRKGNLLVVRMRGGSLSRRHGMEPNWIPTKIMIIRMHKNKDWIIEKQENTDRQWRSVVDRFISDITG